MTIQAALHDMPFANSSLIRRRKIFSAVFAFAFPLFALGLNASPASVPNHSLEYSFAASAQIAPPDSSQIVFTLAPSQSKLHFTLNATAHDVHGEFDFKRGEIRVNPSTGQATGEVVVETASGRSGSDGRDSKMHKDVLESAKFPEIAFHPDRVDGFAAGSATFHSSIHGVFSIHGSNHEITIPVDVSVSGNTWSANCKFKVPFVDWGLHDPSNFFLHVGHAVDIELTLAGSFAGPSAGR